MLTLEAMTDQDLFICPRCGSSVRPERDLWRCSNNDCQYAKEPFPVVSGRPALVDFENSVIDAGRVCATDGASVIRRKRKLPEPLVRLIHGRNRAAPVAVARMLELLRADSAADSRRPRILIVGGGQLGSGIESLYNDPTIELIAFDIYASPIVQFIGDGHAIPLADGSIDGVVAEAVLGCVQEPWVVAQEIYRVLRKNGIVFADSAFMQPVCEGPYDFTRFTDSGLRYLFRRFERIDSGAVAGAGTALLWSIGYFARALTRSLAFGRLIQLCFFWLRYTDAILDTRCSIDAASGVFFLGRKALLTALEDWESYYQGGFPLQ
jgi:hypothetical protein